MKNLKNQNQRRDIIVNPKIILPHFLRRLSLNMQKRERIYWNRHQSLKIWKNPMENVKFAFHRSQFTALSIFHSYFIISFNRWKKLLEIVLN
jgi:hypothetical protein